MNITSNKRPFEGNIEGDDSILYAHSTEIGFNVEGEFRMFDIREAAETLQSLLNLTFSEGIQRLTKTKDYESARKVVLDLLDLEEDYANKKFIRLMKHEN